MTWSGEADGRDRRRRGVIKVTSQGTKCEYVAFDTLRDPPGRWYAGNLPGRVGDWGRGRDVQVQDGWFLFFS